MEKLGTIYGGWYVPTNMNLNEKSIIYSGGVGEDMSFDLLLNDKYNCNIFLIDPTKKAIKHYEEMIDFYTNEIRFTGNIQTDYYSKITNLNIDLNKFHYLNIGLWHKSDTLKFYKQNNAEYVSQSLVENMFGKTYDIVNVDSIQNIMKQNNHTHIDLLKLDIEGAEINVLNKMFDDQIYPKYILIEFDLLIKQKDDNHITKKLMERILIDYTILINDNFNITFIKKS